MLIPIRLALAAFFLALAIGIPLVLKAESYAPCESQTSSVHYVNDLDVP